MSRFASWFYMENDFGRFGFLEVFPISIIREIVLRKNAGIKGNNKTELIKRLIEQDLLTDDDYSEYMELDKIIKEEKRTISSFISKLGNQHLDLNIFATKLSANPYSYDEVNEYVSEAGFGKVEVDSDRLSFEYWYDIPKLEELPGGRTKRDHKSEVLRMTIDKSSELIEVHSKTVQKASKLLGITKKIDLGFTTPGIISDGDSEQNFESFSEFLKKATEIVKQTNIDSFASALPIKILTVEMYSPSGDVKTVVVNGRADIFNNSRIIGLRKELYRPIQIKGSVIYQNITFDFKAGLTVELLGGDIAYITARQHSAASGNNSDLIADVFDLLKKIFIEIFLR